MRYKPHSNKFKRIRSEVKKFVSGMQQVNPRGLLELRVRKTDGDVATVLYNDPRTFRGIYLLAKKGFTRGNQVQR